MRGLRLAVSFGDRIAALQGDRQSIADRHRLFERGRDLPLIVARIDARVDGGDMRHVDRSPGRAGAAARGRYVQRVVGTVAIGLIGRETEVGADICTPFGRQRLFQRDGAGAATSVAAADPKSRIAVRHRPAQRFVRRGACQVERVELQCVADQRAVVGAERASGRFVDGCLDRRLGGFSGRSLAESCVDFCAVACGTGCVAAIAGVAVNAQTSATAMYRPFRLSPHRIRYHPPSADAHPRPPMPAISARTG